MRYVEELVETLREIHGAHVVDLFPAGHPNAGTSDLIDALSARPAGDVYIEIDRNVISDMESSGDATDLLPYLYPVAVRYDNDDVIIHVTDAGRATA